MKYKWTSLNVDGKIRGLQSSHRPICVQISHRWQFTVHYNYYYVKRAVLSCFIQYRFQLRATCSDTAPQGSFCWNEISERDGDATGHYHGETWHIPCFTVMIWMTTVLLGKTCTSCWASSQITPIYFGLCSLVLLSNIIEMAYKISLSVRNLCMNKAAA